MGSGDEAFLFLPCEAGEGDPEGVEGAASAMTALPIQGYASLFWKRDLNDDIVAAGAFDASLARAEPGRVKMLHQHDPTTPIGVWDDVRADGRGLYVKGRILDAAPLGKMSAALVKAGAMDGLSIGFRTVKARGDETRRLRVLTEIDLWEVSLVTFPMLPEARLASVLTKPRTKRRYEIVKENTTTSHN